MDQEKDIDAIEKEQRGQSLLLVEILEQSKVQTALLRAIANDLAPQTRVVGKIFLGVPVLQ